MGKPTGFMEVKRQERMYAPITERLGHFKEFVIDLSEDELRNQGARCMDCGIPYCHQRCPVDNNIPDWNDLVYHGDWKAALHQLHSTNNFPEFTGRVCPAPCQESCTLNIDNEPVTIKTIEQAIAEKGWENNWITPQVARHKTGKRVAVIGSGPSGLACAQQLARAGHQVDVYEKQARIGGLLRAADLVTDADRKPVALAGAFAVAALAEAQAVVDGEPVAALGRADPAHADGAMVGLAGRDAVASADRQRRRVGQQAARDVEDAVGFRTVHQADVAHVEGRGSEQKVVAALVAEAGVLHLVVELGVVEEGRELRVADLVDAHRVVVDGAVDLQIAAGHVGGGDWNDLGRNIGNGCADHQRGGQQHGAIRAARHGDPS